MANNVTPMDANSLQEVKENLRNITKHHNHISKIKTPKRHIKKKMGLDYVKLNYMKKIADENFPGWSFNILTDEYIYQDVIVDNKFVIKYLIQYKVTGRLRWFDNGVMREGDMSASHRVQFKKTRDNYVDIGNDTKSAVTDCQKKAMNVYMNIADDVYKNIIEDTSLDDDQINQLKDAAIDANKIHTINDKIEIGDIDAVNFDKALKKLKRMAKDE